MHGTFRSSRPSGVWARSPPDASARLRSLLRLGAAGKLLECGGSSRQRFFRNRRQRGESGIRRLPGMRLRRDRASLVAWAYLARYALPCQDSCGHADPPRHASGVSVRYAPSPPAGRQGASSAVRSAPQSAFHLSAFDRRSAANRSPTGLRRRLSRARRAACSSHAFRTFPSRTSGGVGSGSGPRTSTHTRRRHRSESCALPPR